MLPSVSVIIVNYNGLEYLKDFFSSLYNTNYPNNLLEIIMVDNISKDGSVDFVKKNFSKVKLIETGYNSGWAVGNNIGAKEAKGEILIFLGADTVVNKNWLLPLVLTLRDESIGSVSPKCLFMDYRDRVNSLGVFYSILGVSGAIGKNSNSLDFQNIFEVFGPTGVCFGIKKKLFFELGELTDDYFMYMEDVEFGWRLQNNNLKTICNTKSIIYHKGHGSNYGLFYKNIFRNTSWMIIRNAPYGLIIPMLLLLAISTFGFTIMLFSKNNVAFKHPFIGLRDSLFSLNGVGIVKKLLKNKVRGIKKIYGIKRTQSSINRIQREHIK